LLKKFKNSAGRQKRFAEPQTKIIMITRRILRRTKRGYSRYNLKVIPLGGVEEIGRNMTVFEYGDDIVIVDMGLQFPEEDMPGIDYIIPNVDYLLKKTKKIKGVIITHGHYDHIGAIPHLIPRLGNPTIYATELTRGIILKRQEEYKVPINVKTIKKTDRFTLGAFNVEFFHVNHTIPDSVGVAIHSPIGTAVVTGDFKFDHSPIGDAPADIASIARIGSEGVLLLLSDSTDSGTPGYSLSESTIMKNLEEIFKEAKGRIIAATFAALISRIQQIVFLAEKYKRRIAVDGYSMKTNIEIAQKMGYLKILKDTMIPISEVNDYSDEKMVILCTGAQGEGNAVLMRIVNGEHRYVKIHKNDTIVFSSSVIPGNERTVQGLKDGLYRKGAKVIHSAMLDVHAGGHARQEDLKLMINLIKPKYLMPVHGHYYMRRMHGELAESVGMKPENILIGDNGQIVEFDYQGNGKVTDERVPANYVMVDGLGVGDIGQVVLRDRQVLARDGMFTIVVIVDSKTKKVIGEPQVTSRGFIYVKENFDLVNATKKRVKDVVHHTTSKKEPVNWAYVKDNIRETVGQFLYLKTQRRPMVLPVVIEV